MATRPTPCQSDTLLRTTLDGNFKWIASYESTMSIATSAIPMVRRIGCKTQGGLPLHATTYTRQVSILAQLALLIDAVQRSMKATRTKRRAEDLRADFLLMKSMRLHESRSLARIRTKEKLGSQAAKVRTTLTLLKRLLRGKARAHWSRRLRTFPNTCMHSRRVLWWRTQATRAHFFVQTLIQWELEEIVKLLQNSSNILVLTKGLTTKSQRSLAPLTLESRKIASIGYQSCTRHVTLRSLTSLLLLLKRRAAFFLISNKPILVLKE